MLPAEIGVIEHVEMDPVFIKQIGAHVVAVLIPVGGKFLWCEHQNIFIAGRVILHHGKRRKCFAETDRIGKDTPVIFLQLLDNADRAVSLKAVQLLPNKGIFEARPFVRHEVFGHDIFQKFAKNVIERYKINKLGGIIGICGRDVIND